MLAQAVERVGSTVPAPIAMLLAGMAPCRKNTRSHGENRSALFALRRHRLRKSSWGDAEHFAPRIKGELDGKNHRTNRRIASRKVNCHFYLKKKGILSLMLIQVVNLQAPGGELYQSFGRGSILEGRVL